STHFSLHDAPTIYLYHLSLHDALPIYHFHKRASCSCGGEAQRRAQAQPDSRREQAANRFRRSRNCRSCSASWTSRRLCCGDAYRSEETRLNSSHDQISYAVFCLKKKKK